MKATQSRYKIIWGLVILLLGIQVNSCVNDKDASGQESQSYSDLLKENWKAPDTTQLTNSEKDQLILYGKDLIERTGNFFGPYGSISKSANGMNCQNCHLMAGRRLFANSFSAVHANYPKLRARSGKLEYLERRINDCMERSMNGHALDSLSKEMRAMVAYINWVGKDVPKDSVPEGASVVDLKFLERAADPEKGKVVFEVQCVRCHKTDGSGMKGNDSTYLYPPLWGDHSYNTGAGMYRLSRLAAFIKSNMPFDKSTYENPVLSDEEAWDIAAYINSQPRPEKKFPFDWPDIAKKPIDHPFGPYADNFSEYQHKYGPFGIIREASKNKK